MERYGLCLPSESNGKNRGTPLSLNLSAWCVDLMRGHLLHFVLPLFWKSANILGPTTYRAKAILCFFLIHIPALMMVDFLLVSCGPFLPAKRPTHFRPFCLIFPQIRVLSDNTLSQIHFTLLIPPFWNYLGFLIRNVQDIHLHCRYLRNHDFSGGTKNCLEPWTFSLQ